MSELINIDADVYARKLDVLNRGFSGYTTEWAIPIFKQVPIHFFLNRRDSKDPTNCT